MAKRRKSYLSRWIKTPKAEVNHELETRSAILVRALGPERNFIALEQLGEMCQEKIHAEQTRASNAGKSGLQDHCNGQIEGINYFFQELTKVINYQKNKNKLTKKKKKGK